MVRCCREVLLFMRRLAIGREAIARPWGSFYVRPCNVLLEVRFIRGSLQIDHAGGRVFRAPRVLGILAILAPRQSVHSATRQQLQTKCCARLPLIVQGPSLLASWRKVGPLRNEGSPVLFSLGGLGGLGHCTACRSELSMHDLRSLRVWSCPATPRPVSSSVFLRFSGFKVLLLQLRQAAGQVLIRSGSWTNFFNT